MPKKQTKYYAVKQGYFPGVYTSWSECQQQIKGYKGSVFKSFTTLQEANCFLKIGSHSSKHKRKRSEQLFEQNDNDNDTNKIKIKIIEVYTDGACRNNGKLNASAGIGAYFPQHLSLNISEPLPYEFKPTNQKAELYAIIKAIETSINVFGDSCEIIIYTDSQYSIQCIKEWIFNWKRNGWVTKEGKPVVNRKLIEQLDCLFNKHSVKMVKVKGHSGNYGNEMADRLAVEGINKYQHTK